MMIRFVFGTAIKYWKDHRAVNRVKPLVCLFLMENLNKSDKYLLLTECAVRTVSYMDRVFFLALWPKREERGT